MSYEELCASDIVKSIEVSNTTHKLLAPASMDQAVCVSGVFVCVLGFFVWLSFFPLKVKLRHQQPMCIL